MSNSYEDLQATLLGCTFEIRDPTGRALCEVVVSDFDTEARLVASRAAACWNALSGIPDAELAGLDVRGLLERCERYGAVLDRILDEHCGSAHGIAREALALVRKGGG